MKHRSFLNLDLRTVMAIVFPSVISGRASDPRYKDGIAWVQSQVAKRQRLQAAACPQHNLD